MCIRDRYRDAKQFIKSVVPVEEYLADQLMLPMGIAASQGHCSSFRTFELSGHSQTHLDILKLFLDIETQVEADDGNVIVNFKPRRDEATAT